ncbi:hypothetical protein HF283_14760, partial [Acidithiobacillus ferrooxidans]|nr:hypothetical protein [Acidithiobacillus ferrooxidans]
MATRESKGNPTQEELKWDWRDRARESGIDLSAVAAKEKEVVQEAVNDRLSQGESNGRYFKHAEETELHADEKRAVELSLSPDHVRDLSVSGLAGVKEWERAGLLQDSESADRHRLENVRREPAGAAA